ncbi:FadR family transcriptional regulator [Sulfobacillus sp. DSM 109850]|uniref:FadR family transcriptional regulator n=1 Tax=Sulfobacillus harzensis TaxID=2729629 RepID=A0A7Y0Q2Y5_9FIRM|nr:FadR family transcriptional regulator [Sulfobacillus harzensis]
MSLIREGAYQPNDKLPSLQEMARVLKVSKSTIREGLAALVAKGIIDVRHGSGYYVRPSKVAAKSMPEESPDLGQVLFVRQLLEVSAARLAAVNRNDDHLAVMAGCLARMQREDWEEALGADLEFHLAIAGASGNQVLEQVIGSLSQHTKATMKLSRAIAGTLADLHQKHWELYRAICDGDGERASQLMYVHLHDTAERMKILIPGTRLGDTESSGI